ncbi:hypothetical protein E2C01_092052 [Portunus trituberculatus]|uniref:Uncharacterized protein n=1 Tax=Portunus trituberculatus TaxID=210409 RepID=A0A5B7JWQ9_PORTR|nr:hypothetical protein [Portunus trituberculatus]
MAADDVTNMAAHDYLFSYLFRLTGPSRHVNLEIVGCINSGYERLGLWLHFVTCLACIKAKNKDREIGTGLVLRFLTLFWGRIR